MISSFVASKKHTVSMEKLYGGFTRTLVVTNSPFVVEVAVLIRLL